MDEALDAQLREWHCVIGRGVTSFGRLERSMLHWAGMLRQDGTAVEHLHMSDMKAIAPALRAAVEYYGRRLSPSLRETVRDQISAAQNLIPDRNDLAHGWLYFPMLICSRPPRDEKLWLRLQPIEWAEDVVRRIESTASGMELSMRAILQELRTLGVLPTQEG